MNSRKLLIFGNGLGMAIDPNHYSLNNALKAVWDNNKLWYDQTDKLLIQNCIPHRHCPNSEDDMDDLYLAATACEFLNSIPSPHRNVHWLSENGVSFPKATLEYLHVVATYLHNSDHILPKYFEHKLINFIKDTKSHVATLNYDKLLYNAFIENKITDGYSGSLVDGITNNGFSEANLERKFKNDFGYYLHLHGSPLFFEESHKIYKMDRYQLDINKCFASKHIVLTHIKHKPAVISNSEILSIYWQYLNFSISEVKDIVLFGYSGLDKHLNQLIKMHAKRVSITVIEWTGSGEHHIRQNFWDRELNTNVYLKQLDDITNYTSW